MQINLVYDPSVANAPTGFKGTLQAAANVLDNVLAGSNINVTIDVGWGELNGWPLAGVTLGEAEPASGQLLAYNQLVTDLKAHPTSAADQTFLANLPASDPANGQTWFVPSAQEKALGLLPASANGVDGFAGFSSTAPWTYGDANGVAPGTYDLEGVALHELTHVLGREATQLTPFDLGTYNMVTHQLDLQNGPQDRYFSIDGGSTHIVGIDGPNDASDFTETIDPFNALLAPGTKYVWSSLDTEIMNILGYSSQGPMPTQQGSSASHAGSRVHSRHHATISATSLTQGKPAFLASPSSPTPRASWSELLANIGADAHGHFGVEVGSEDHAHSRPLWATSPASFDTMIPHLMAGNV
jgi:hypothetical protein